MQSGYGNKERVLPYVVLIIILSSLFIAINVDCLEEPTPTCPVDFHECLEIDFVAELERAHMLDPSTHPIGVSLYPGISDRTRQIQDWELEAIQMIGYGLLGKDYLDILETDEGAHGFAHFQPPNGLDLEELEIYELIDERQDIRWIEQRIWIQHIEEILYSPYGIVIQLNAWRDNLEYAISQATQNGWEGGQLTVAASIANSTGGRGFLDLAELQGWCPKQTLEGYLAQRPDSLHRQRRASQLQDFL